MKKFIVALAAAACCALLPSFAMAAPAPAPVADPQTVAAVRSMLEATDTRKMMMVMNAEMEKSMPALLQSQLTSMIEGDASLSAAQKREMQAKLDRALPVLLKSMRAVFSDPALMDEVIDAMVPLYANNFTTAEINELSAFYRTPLGRKMIATLPRISAESVAISQRLLMPRMSKIVQDFVQDLQKQ